MCLLIYLLYIFKTASGSKLNRAEEIGAHTLDRGKVGFNYGRIDISKELTYESSHDIALGDLVWVEPILNSSNILKNHDMIDITASLISYSSLVEFDHDIVDKARDLQICPTQHSYFSLSVSQVLDQYNIFQVQIPSDLENIIPNTTTNTKVECIQSYYLLISGRSSTFSNPQKPEQSHVAIPVNNSPSSHIEPREYEQQLKQKQLKHIKQPRKEKITKHKPKQIDHNPKLTIIENKNTALTVLLTVRIMFFYIPFVKISS